MSLSACGCCVSPIHAPNTMAMESDRTSKASKHGFPVGVDKVVTIRSHNVDDGAVTKYSTDMISTCSEMSDSLCSFSSAEVQDAGPPEVVMAHCSQCHVGDSIFTGQVLFYDHSKQQAVSTIEKPAAQHQSVPLLSLLSQWRWRRGLGACLMLFGLLLGIIAYFTMTEPEVHESLPEPWLVSREMWKARQPWTEFNHRNKSDPFPLVIIIHTGGRQCRSLEDCSRIVYRMQRLHQMDFHWDDIAYNFLIGGDGRVYEGRGFNYIGGHTSTCNPFCLGIAYIGDYRSLYDNAVPSTIQIKATFHLIETSVKKGLLKPMYSLVPHCHAIPQESPGDNIYCAMRSWPNFRDDNITVSGNGHTLSAICPYTCGSSTQDISIVNLL